MLVKYLAFLNYSSCWTVQIHFAHFFLSFQSPFSSSCICYDGLETIVGRLNLFIVRLFRTCQQNFCFTFSFMKIPCNLQFIFFYLKNFVDMCCISYQISHVLSLSNWIEIPSHVSNSHCGWRSHEAHSQVPSGDPNLNLTRSGMSVFSKKCRPWKRRKSLWLYHNGSFQTSYDRITVMLQDA